MAEILVINPNTTRSMTEKIGRAAAAAAATGTSIHAINPADGPVSIEGAYDDVFAAAAALRALRAAPTADGYVIACFDDTGLDGARALLDGPVVGIGEAAFHFASLVGHKFGVVTTLERAVPTLERNLAAYGLAARCARVAAAEVAVLDLEEPGSDAARKVEATARRLVEEDGAEAIALGCAGMADLADRMSDALGVPVVDGVASAVKLVEGLIATGLKTSRRGAYAPPGAKPYKGAFAIDAPEGDAL